MKFVPHVAPSKPVVLPALFECIAAEDAGLVAMFTHEGKGMIVHLPSKNSQTFKVGEFTNLSSCFSSAIWRPTKGTLVFE